MYTKKFAYKKQIVIVRNAVTHIQNIMRMALAYRTLMRLSEEKKALILRSACRIQSIFRMRKAKLATERRRVAYNYASQQIQKVWRMRAAVIKMCAERTSVRLMQSCIRRFNARRRFYKCLELRAAQLQECVDLHMGELAPLIFCDHVFNITKLSVDQDKLNTMQKMSESKRQIRYLYMKFACEGVGDPAKAFKMSKHQFTDMCRHIKHTKDFDKGATKNFFDEKGCSNIFDAANEDCNIAERLKLRKAGGEVKDNYASEVDRVLEQHEFICALVRLAAHRYHTILQPVVEEELAADTELAPAITSSAKAVVRYIDEIITPWFTVTQEADTKEKENKAELISKIAAPQLPKYGTKIKKLYKKVSQAGDGPGSEGADSMDCTEFLTFAKNCKLCDSHFSMSGALEVYMYCNQEEMQAYFEKAPPMSDINQELEMDEQEFVNALLLIAACKLKIVGGVSDKKMNDYVKKFEKLMDDMIEKGNQAFAHIVTK